MTSDYPDLIADTLEPYSDLLANIPARSHAPQTWNVTVSDAKFHWYDLVAGFPEIPDIRDPVGRYLRRMQFDLEATMEKRLVYFVINRPRIRFDTKRSVQWGFFSLKLTIPLVVGAEEKRESITIELEVPFSATLKKPNVTMTDRFITMNWGGFVEALSIHDLLQNYENDLKFPSKVMYVGQTKDPAGRLAKAKLPAVQKLHQNNCDDYDTLLLIQRMNVTVASAEGDPADLPDNQNAVAADLLLKERVDLIECALIAYFEDPALRLRNTQEAAMRRERVREVQEVSRLEGLTIDLKQEAGCNYQYLRSDRVGSSCSHKFECAIVDGQIGVSRIQEAVKA